MIKKSVVFILLILFLVVGFLPVLAKTAKEWNNEGVKLFNQKNYEEALECFSEAIKLNPKEAVYWYNKGNTLYQLKKYTDAIIYLDEALQLNPDYSDAKIVEEKNLAALKNSNSNSSSSKSNHSNQNSSAISIPGDIYIYTKGGENLTFSLTVPKNWIVDDSGKSGYQVVISGPSSMNGSAVVSVKIDKVGDMTAKEYYDKKQKDLSTKVDNLEEMEGYSINHDGSTGYQAEIKYRAGGVLTEPYGSVVRVEVKNGYAFKLTSTANGMCINNDIHNTFLGITNSFTIKPATTATYMQLPDHYTPPSKVTGPTSNSWKGTVKNFFADFNSGLLPGADALIKFMNTDNKSQTSYRKASEYLNTYLNYVHDKSEFDYSHQYVAYYDSNQLMFYTRDGITNTSVGVFHSIYNFFHNFCPGKTTLVNIKDSKSLKVHIINTDRNMSPLAVPSNLKLNAVQALIQLKCTTFPWSNFKNGTQDFTVLLSNEYYQDTNINTGKWRIMYILPGNYMSQW